MTSMPGDHTATLPRKRMGSGVLTPGRLLVVDWVPPRTGRTEGVMFIYSGGVLDADQERDFVLPAEELRGWAWCTETQADERLSALLARRVRAAVHALHQGTTSYLENGTQALPEPG